MTKSHSSGNGNQMRHLVREGKSASKVLQAQIDTAVKLADREVGIQHSEFSIQNSGLPAADIGPRTSDLFSRAPSPQRPVPLPSGLPSAPTLAVPPPPAPDPISAVEY